MVDRITRTSPLILPVKRGLKTGAESAKPENHRQVVRPKWPFVERRKQGDRRKNRGRSRGLFELRSGRGRRKTDRLNLDL